MQALFHEIHSFFKAFHPFCKRILKWGSPLVFSLFVAAGFCRLAAGQIGVYDKMLRLSSEFCCAGGKHSVQLWFSRCFYSFCVWPTPTTTGKVPCKHKNRLRVSADGAKANVQTQKF